MLRFIGFNAQGGIQDAYELISTTVLGSNTASVTFSNLGDYSSTYKHLQIRCTQKSATTAGTQGLRLRVNSDTGSNYNWHYIYGGGVNIVAAAQTSSSLFDGGLVAGTTANIFSTSIIDLLDVYSTSKNKAIRGLSGNAQTSENFIWLSSGAWRNTNALTSINLFVSDSSNFATGSRFSLYGIKG